MANASKFIQKMRQNPINWRIEQFETIARAMNITVRKTGGSHVIFEHKKWYESLSVPAHRPIKPIYVKKFLKLLEQIIGEENEH